MESGGARNGLGTRLGAGLAAGAAIAFVDNVAFGGEASPIVVVALLLAASGTAGALWRRRGWIAAMAAWAWIPMAHIVKHLLGLPDTLHPNTPISILLLAAFSLAVTAIGAASGIALGALLCGAQEG